MLPLLAEVELETNSTRGGINKGGGRIVDRGLLIVDTGLRLWGL